MLTVHYMRNEPGRPLPAAWRRDKDAVFHWRGGRKIGSRRFGDLRRWEHGTEAWFIKRYVYPSARIRETLIGSRSFREWKNLVRMKRIGLPQPEVILVATRRQKVGVTGSIIVTRAVSRSTDLERQLRGMDSDPDPAYLERLAEGLCRMIGRMHAAGFCHWDLKARNILVTTSDGTLDLVPIDSVNGRSIHWYNRRHCALRDYGFLLEDPLLGPFMAKALRSRMLRSRDPVLAWLLRSAGEGKTRRFARIK